ncbi:MAG: universal stress protein [Propionibacteriaceae bacterium]|jgi:nucleotide-binding universal stress UspA family protein|nr:universal stress protein [Propionibacteriaceae bacterium]
MSELPITVGFDGSDFALEALRKGLSLGSRLGLPVRVIRAWSISNAPRPKTWSPGYVPPVEEFAAAVSEQLESQIAGLLDEYPQVEVRVEVPHGAAGRELIKASEDSELIVVGTRGSGGFSGLLLGSVTDQIVEHAKCDVLVTRRRCGDPAPPRTLQLDSAIDGE